MRSHAKDHPTVGELFDDASVYLQPLDAAERQKHDWTERLVTSVELFDEHQVEQIADSIVLMPGSVVDLADPEQSARILRRASLVVVSSDDVWTADFRAQLPPLLVKTPWIGWSDLFRMLTRLVGVRHRDARGMSASSLHELASHVADITGSAITIEDTSSRVLAYSPISEETDDLRVHTILQGAVPSWRVEELMSSGFLPAVWNSSGVVERHAEPGNPARYVIAVRSGDEVLGAIWATDSTQADGEQIREVLAAAAVMAAPLIVRETLHEQHQTEQRTAALTALFSGHGDLPSAGQLLSLPSGTDHFCLAVTVTSPRDEVDHVAFHIQAIFPHALLDTWTGIVRVLIPVDGTDADEAGGPDVAELGGKLSRRLADDCLVTIGVGPRAETLRDIHVSMEEATAISQVLRDQRQADEKVLVSDLSGVLAGVELKRLAHRLVERREADPYLDTLSRLRDYDIAHGSSMVGTLAAYLRHVGNVAEIARELQIHGNSVRYRLQRIGEITGCDLSRSNDRTFLAIALEIDGVTGVLRRSS